MSVFPKMFNELIQFYKIGIELGLTKKEMSRTFLFQNRRSLLFSFLIIILIFIFTFILAIAFIVNSKEIYPSGALYSSVSINEFKNKKYSKINKIRKVLVISV